MLCVTVLLCSATSPVGVQSSSDEYLRALIGYVCSPVLESLTSTGVHASETSSDPKSSSSSSTDATPEIALKRFGLQILQAVIEKAPAVPDGEDDLPGMWQARPEAGGAAVRRHHNRRGPTVDEDAIRLERVRNWIRSCGS